MNVKPLILGLVFLALMSSFAAADYYNFSHNQALSDSGSNTALLGVQIQSNVTMTMSNVTKFSDSQATNCYVKNMSGTQIATGTFDGNSVCVLTPSVTLLPDRYYFVNADKTGNAYTWKGIASGWGHPMTASAAGTANVILILNGTVDTTTQTTYSLFNFRAFGVNFSNETSNMLDITLKNIYNSSSISNFTATISNATISQTITTTNGTIFWPKNGNINISIFNITGTEGAYFNVSYVNQNTTSNLVAETYQAKLILDAKEKITNLPYGAFNATAGSYFNVSNSSNQTTLLLNAGTYTVTGRSGSSSYNATKAITVSALEIKTDTLLFAPDQLNISARDYFSNATINSFTAQINYNNTYYENVTATAGLAQFYGINGTYNVTVNSSGYSSGNSLTNLTSISQNLTFYLFPQNSIYIHIYNQSSGAIVTDNITITFTTSSGQFQNYTSNGTLFASGLVSGAYTITFEGGAYSKATYYATVAEGSSQTLDAYLLSSTITNAVVFEVIDSNSGDPLESATISVSRIVSNVWELVTVLTTDLTGRTQLTFEAGKEYAFIISKSGYVTRAFTLNPILFTSYSIKLTPDSTSQIASDYAGVNIYFTPGSFTENTNPATSFTFFSPFGSFEYFGYNMSFIRNYDLYNGSGQTLVNSIAGYGVNAYGADFVSNLSIGDASADDVVLIQYFYKLTYGEQKNFTVTYPVILAGKNNTMEYTKGKNYGLGSLERTTIGVLTTVLFAGGASLYIGALPAFAIGFGWTAFLIYKGFVDFWIFIISMLCIFIILLWRSANG